MFSRHSILIINNLRWTSRIRAASIFGPQTLEYKLVASLFYIKWPLAHTVGKRVGRILTHWHLCVVYMFSYHTFFWYMKHYIQLLPEYNIAHNNNRNNMKNLHDVYWFLIIGVSFVFAKWCCSSLSPFGGAGGKSRIWWCWMFKEYSGGRNFRRWWYRYDISTILCDPWNYLSLGWKKNCKPRSDLLDFKSS